MMPESVVRIEINFKYAFFKLIHIRKTYVINIQWVSSVFKVSKELFAIVFPDLDFALCVTECLTQFFLA